MEKQVVESYSIFFGADLHSDNRKKIAKALGLTLKRTDDWDQEVGFRLVDGNATLRLFQFDGECLLIAQASKPDSQKLLLSMIDDCIDAIESIGGAVDRKKIYVSSGFWGKEKIISEQPEQEAQVLFKNNIAKLDQILAQKKRPSAPKPKRG